MSYDINDVRKIVHLTIQASLNSKDLLTELDSRSGDGDLGISIEKGMFALKRELFKYEGADIGEFLTNCAVSVNRAAPSTMGTLISSAIMALGKEFKGKREITDSSVIKIPNIMANAIINRGKAQRGDKTILDSLIPLSEVFESSYDKNRDLKTALNEAAIAARNGAEGTRGMIARIGRAKWIAERSRIYPDGGATLCANIAVKLAEETVK